MKIIDKLALIEIQNRKILSTRSKGKDTFYIPGGKRELGESDHQVLIREIKEELTVDIVPETIEFIGVFEAQAHGHAEGILVKMTCYEAQFEGHLRPASEIEAMEWLTMADKFRISPVDKLIFDFLHEQDLID